MSNNGNRNKRILLCVVIASIVIDLILLFTFAIFFSANVISSESRSQSAAEATPETEAPAESTSEPLSDTSEDNRGTTPGNMQNGGYAVAAGDWIYYYADYNLYKTQTGSDDSEILIENVNSLLNDPFWGNLNIAEDGNIYFVTMHGSVYRVPADGGTPTIFIEGETTPYMQGVNEFLIVGEWLYYNYENSTQNTSTRSSVIKRIHLDRSDDQVLIGDDNDHIYWLQDVADDYIYYTDGTHEEEALLNARIPVSGGQQERIDFISYSNTIQIIDGWLYYRDDMDVCRIRPDGSDQQVIFDESYCYQFNVAEDWIYCQVTDEEGDTDNRYVIRVKTDGTDVQVVNDEDMMNFAVAGDVMATMLDGMMRINSD